MDTFDISCILQNKLIHFSFCIFFYILKFTANYVIKNKKVLLSLNISTKNHSFYTYKFIYVYKHFNFDNLNFSFGFCS